VARYREDSTIVDTVPDDFYSSRFLARKMIDYIDSNRDDEQPFFGYLAFTAPHWPLQAPAESIARQAGRYDDGYDKLHARRVAGLKRLGLIRDDLEASPRLPGEPAWDDLTVDQQKREARLMEIYAAMVSDVDTYVGEVVAYLKSIDEFDNTFILFMSDNGAEGHPLDQSFSGIAKWSEECCDNSYKNMGNRDSYLWYGPNWARASVGPWRMFKAFTSEGGIRAPAIVHYPQLDSGKTNDQLLTVMDVMPTALELAGTSHPGPQYKDRTLHPLKGVSMLPMLRGDVESTHADDYVMGWELFGKTAIRAGDWKILQEPVSDWWAKHRPATEPYVWQLFNLRDDPSELNDLAAQNPEKLSEMLALWDQYARDHGVIIPDEVVGY
jgi:arylsulfatase A-like enzyme